jgi:A/G-specific adenine glycosylase
MARLNANRRAQAAALPLTGRSKTRFRAALLGWFDRRCRELPWRANRDPYRVWVSEIMLQQTRVAAVLEPYTRFLKRFPGVISLAKARPATVLAAWSGLGYYRRARRLHRAARQIVLERRGRFPASSAEWRALPGVGRYTAAAIASICYGEPCAVVDGNVRRVIQRLEGRRAGGLWERAGGLLSRRRPGDFNQAMMELGALVCTPAAPRCGCCPVHAWCAGSRSLGEPQQSGAPKRAVPGLRRTARVTYALVTQSRRVLLCRRSEDETIMPGMWELPPAPVNRSPQEEAFTLRHSIMNTTYVVTVTRVPFTAACPGEWVTAGRAGRLPLTGLARKILQHAKILKSRNS